MIDALATGFSYLPLALSRNQLVLRQPAPSPQLYPNRALLKFRLRLYVQAFFRSEAYNSVTPVPLEASELPPRRFGTQVVYRGAPFEMQDLLDSELNLTPPLFDQRYISVVEGMTRQYFTERDVLNGPNVILTEQSPMIWAIKAGIREADYEFFASRLFTDPAARAGKFLTWQPDNKAVLPDQPEYLFFLVNTQPAPMALRLRVEYTYTDGTKEDATRLTLNEVTPMTVYCVPVGPVVVDVVGRSKPVRSYTVWVSDGANARLSETRTYRVDSRYVAQCRYLLFDNSLGGFDTLVLRGKGAETLTTGRDVAERPTDIDGQAAWAERIVTDARNDRELSVYSGYLSQAERTWLTELGLARQIFLVSDRAHVPLVNRSEKYVPEQDDEGLIGRQFLFVYSNQERNHSVLPMPSPALVRPTNWVAYQVSCELNANGLRTGRQLTVLKRLVYTDTGQPVEPQQIALNLPGEAGYVEPVASNACATTPFTNTRISQQGTFVRSNCAGNQVGSAALIVVGAGLFGSEFSQADADAKAQDYWNTLNTQAYADQYGSCVLGQFQNVLISQYGTFYRNTCGNGQVGQRALIVIPGGSWASNISQADANAKAQQQWDSLNTQATANTQGDCVSASQQVWNRGNYIVFILTRNANNTYTLTYNSMGGYVCQIRNLPPSATETTQSNGQASPPGGKYTTSVLFPASLFGTEQTVTIDLYNGTGGFAANWSYIESFMISWEFF